MSSSFRLPFQVVGGRISSTNDADVQIRQKIIDVLVTDKFERPMLPNYGAGTNQLLFEGVDELTEVDYKVDAVQEITTRVSGVNIIDIRIEPTEENEAAITVYYRTPLSTVKSTTFYVVIPGSLDEETPI